MLFGAQPGIRLRAQQNAAWPGAPAFVTSRLFRPPEYSVPSEKYFEGGTNSASRRLLDEPFAPGNAALRFPRKQPAVETCMQNGTEAGRMRTHMDSGARRTADRKSTRLNSSH